VSNDERVTDQLDTVWGDMAVPEVDGAVDMVARQVLDATD